MKKNILYYLFLVILIVFTSCEKSNSDEEKEKSRRQKYEQVDAKNKEAILNLSKKYNSSMSWDTIPRFVANYQELFIEGKRLMSFEGTLIDVIKSDSFYVLEVHYNNYINEQEYLARISLPASKFSEFKNKFDSSNVSNEGCFIIKVSKITSPSFHISSESYCEQNESHSYITYDFNKRILFFDGELIDFRLNETTE